MCHINGFHLFTYLHRASMVEVLGMFLVDLKYFYSKCYFNPSTEIKLSKNTIGLQSQIYTNKTMKGILKIE